MKISQIRAGFRTAITWSFGTVVLVGLPVPAMASQSGVGTINGIYVLEGGVVLFHHGGSRSALPACGTPNPARWAFDGTTPAGQAKLALLLSAHSAQKPVVVHGTGACTNWGDTETIQFIVTAD